MKAIKEPRAELRLTGTDRLLLGLLRQDARRSISEMAEIVNVSRATVKDRIDIMRDRGVIRRFTIDVAEELQTEPESASAFFLVRLKRPVCKILYAALAGWPEIAGCWSIAGDLDMMILVTASSNREIERLRDRVCRHPEVRTMTTHFTLREWTDRRDRRYLEILDHQHVAQNDQGLVSSPV